jgi:hypothetical protein
MTDAIVISDADEARLVDWIGDKLLIQPAEGSDVPCVERIELARPGRRRDVLVIVEGDELDEQSPAEIWSRMSAAAIDYGEPAKYEVVCVVILRSKDQQRGPDDNRRERRTREFRTRRESDPAVLRGSSEAKEAGGPLNAATGTLLGTMSRGNIEQAARADKRAEHLQATYLDRYEQHTEARLDMLEAHYDSNLELNLDKLRLELQVAALEEQQGFWSSPIALELFKGVAPSLPALFQASATTLAAIAQAFTRWATSRAELAETEAQRARERAKDERIAELERRLAVADERNKVIDVPVSP